VTRGGEDSTVGTPWRVNSVKEGGRGEILKEAFDVKIEKSMRNFSNVENEPPRRRDSQNSTPLYAMCGKPAISSATRWIISDVSSRDILEIKMFV